MCTSETRAIERDSLFVRADLMFEGAAAPARVTVRNLSAGGMMVEHEMRVKRGQRVAVVLKNIGPVAGVVVWVRSPKFGIAFGHEIDPKRARTRVYAGAQEAPVYAQAALPPPPREAWRGKLRLV